jgi:hypothetical protein
MYMFKYIDFRIFFISLAIGLFYVYISEDYKKVIVIYPTPDNLDKYQYKDRTGTCFSYTLKDVKCPLDDNLIHNVKMQN